MSIFNHIIAAISDYRVSADIKPHELTVINGDNNHALHVYEEESFSQDGQERFAEYIVEFATQHRHFDEDDEDDIIDYILSVLEDKVLPIEFYSDGKRRFGGEIKAEALNTLSVAYLTQQYGFISDRLPTFDYEIHSWSGKYDTGLRRVADLK